jgi:hypothetical protein
MADSENSEKKTPAPVDLFADFATDDDKMKNGVWIPYKTAKICIASMNSERYRQARALLNKKFPTQESLESEEAQIALESIIAKHIVLGWTGMAESYSLDAAKRALRLRGFREWVAGIATDDAHFRPDEEPILKN